MEISPQFEVNQLVEQILEGEPPPHCHPLPPGFKIPQSPFGLCCFGQLGL